MAGIGDPQRALDHLRELQRLIRNAIVGGQATAGDRAAVSRSSSADTIYAIDAVVEEILEDYLRHWSRELPMVVVAEGLEPETGKTFPENTPPDACPVRLILDPIDGTRMIMYDKRSAWSLAGLAPNKGPATRLSDIEIACMSELPTTRAAYADVLYAIKHRGAGQHRQALYPGLPDRHLLLRPSSATHINHAFATVSNFFPGTKVLASELMEYLVAQLIGPADVTKATVFDDQYISTGGQFYELAVGHDRFICDLRPLFYRLQHQPAGLCCHPYDCCTVLIAREAGVIVTDGLGNDLDGPLDTTTGLSWAGFANEALRQAIQPLITAFFQKRGLDF